LLAASELKQRGFSFLVNIVGDGPLRKPLEKQIHDLGLMAHVEIMGYVSDILGLLSSARFTVHTADYEGCPNAVMEAMACSRPVVATDAGDIPSLVEDGKTGFVVRRGDDAMLVERMAKLIVNADLCHRLGEEGRAKAEREFRLERLVAETLAAYRSVGWTDF
jgi:glycosyltransferase involved in cell wall biosynthesis